MPRKRSKSLRKNVAVPVANGFFYLGNAALELAKRSTQKNQIRGGQKKRKSRSSSRESTQQYAQNLNENSPVSPSEFYNKLIDKTQSPIRQLNQSKSTPSYYPQINSRFLALAEKQLSSLSPQNATKKGRNHKNYKN